MSPLPLDSSKDSGAGLWSRFAALTGTIAFRLAAVIVAAIMLAGAVAVIAMFWFSSSAVSRQLVDLLQAEAGEYVELAKSDRSFQIKLLIAERGAVDPSRLYLLADGKLDRLAGNLKQWPKELAGNAPGGTFQYMPSAGDDSRFGAGVVVALADNTRLLVGRDLSDQRALALRALGLLLFGFGLIALAGLGAGLAMGGLVLRRIEAMSATAERVMGGDLSGRIEVSRRGDELDRLGGNLNAMLDRIEQLMAGLREVSDNIAHDLKTPLTRLRHQAESALRDPGVHRAGLERVIEEADALIVTFNALLQIARLEAGALESTAEVFDIGALVTDVAELYQPLAEETGLALDTHVGVGLTVMANRQLVGQAVANLVDNAIKYGRPAPGSTASATVEVRAFVAGECFRIVVADHGPGIPAADRERVLKRFVRLDQSRTAPGTGLGLSLVAAVSRLIGGRLILDDNGPGLRVTLELPKRTAPRSV